MLQSLTSSLKYPSTSDLCAAVERQAAACPEPAALTDTAYSHTQTLSQLVSSSAKCTKLLSAQGVGPGSLVALQLSEPGLPAFPAAVGLLGVLRSGSSAFFSPGSAGRGQLPLPSTVSALLLTEEPSQLASKGSSSASEVGCTQRAS